MPLAEAPWVVDEEDAPAGRATGTRCRVVAGWRSAGRSQTAPQGQGGSAGRISTSAGFGRIRGEGAVGDPPADAGPALLLPGPSGALRLPIRLTGGGWTTSRPLQSSNQRATRRGPRRPAATWGWTRRTGALRRARATLPGQGMDGLSCRQGAALQNRGEWVKVALRDVEARLPRANRVRRAGSVTPSWSTRGTKRSTSSTRRRGRKHRAGPASRLGARKRGARSAPAGLMAEQKLAVPLCPLRGNGPGWRFDRERSARDCAAVEALRAGVEGVLHLMAGARRLQAAAGCGRPEATGCG